MGRTKQTARKTKTKKSPTKPAPPKDVEAEDSNDSSEEEEVEAVPVKKPTPSKKDKKAAKKVEKEESSDDDSEEEEMEVDQAKANGKKKAQKKEESEEEDSDEEEEAPKPAKEAAKEESGSDSEEDEEEEEKPKPKAAKTKKAEDSDDESEEEDSDEEEEKEESDNKSKKRKAKEEKKAAKKPKIDEDAAEVKVTLFIANLPQEFEDAKLKKWFEKKDIPVSEIRMSPSKKNFCYVDIENADDLENALALNGEEFKGSALKIEQAKPRVKKDDAKPEAPRENARGGDHDDQDSTLFVKNLPYDVSKEAVEGHFDGCLEVRMPTRPDGSYKGFAFVKFGSTEALKEAMDKKQGSDLNGSAIYLDFVGQKSTFKPDQGRTHDRSVSTGEKGKTKVLFVKNLSYDLNGEGLKGHFEGATTARVASFPDSGKSRGFGFVEFATPEAAQEAFDSMKDAEIEGRQIRLDFASELGSGAPRGDFRQGQWRGGRGGGDRGRGGGGRGFGGGRGRGGDRGGGRGFGGGRGRGGDRGGRGGGFKRDNIQEFRGSKKTFDD
jgi:nucleolin